MQNEALCQAHIEEEIQTEDLRQAQLELENSLGRYVDLYEFAPVGYLTLTSEGMISEINLTAVTLLGKERKNLLNKSLRTFFITEDQDKWVRHFQAVKKPDEQGAVELAMRRGDGMVFYARLDCVAYKSSVRVTLLDITRRKLDEDELRIAAVAFSSLSGMVITDPEGVIQRVNPAFSQVTGYSAEEAIGQTPAMLHSGRQGPLFYQKMWAELKEKGYWQGEIWNKRKNGNVYAELLTISAIYSPDQSIAHFVGNFTDITDIKEAEAEIHRLAYYDLLTKLPNRRLLQDRLKQAISATARSKMYGALFFIDLDRFKALNDTRGHDVGDLLLVDVAQRLREAVRETDTVARQGGDEFVVLMEELGATANEAAVLAEQLGNKVHAALDSPFNLNGYEYHCMSSIGVGLFHANDTVEALFKHADLALYQAKNEGREKLRFFNPAMQDAIDQRSILESALQKVLPLKQLRLYYQPQLDVARRVVGVEALLRWQHPQRGLVPPDEFIPLAEDTGLILPIGRWVMETACAQIKAWENDAHTRELQIAVNVSARQFRQPDFVTQVQSALVSSGANPACLKLELTESMLQEDVKDTIAKMQAIKQLGVCFSLDDFGTGYSSLSYLAQLPLDQIKIDKAFVRNLPGVTNDETIARAIITMGLGLNMNVIAEGVETEIQREFLAAHGCHEYQGYLFSRPLTIEALETFLQRK
jgi:diguanylate cyclase (GGDEF)-like protein/PAS domain S-box-containing protein